MTDVAVVIGNYEGEHLLPECLGSVAGQSVAPADVVVVDAGSTDAGAEVATGLGARVVSAPNIGLGYLYNRGVEAVDAPFVLLANNDVSFDRRCIELLRDALVADGERFAADPRQMDWAGSRLVHARTELRRGPLFHRVLPGFDLDLTVPADEPLPTLTANGGAMLVRRDRFLELGGFDETFFMDFEDIDLCWRAWLRGWPTVYVPEAWLRHRVGAVTTTRVLPKRIASSHHNLLRFAFKCFPARAAGTILAGELLRLPRHPRVIAPALVRVALELPEIIRRRRELRPSSEFFDWAVAGMPT